MGAGDPASVTQRLVQWGKGDPAWLHEAYPRLIHHEQDWSLARAWLGQELGATA